MDTVLTPYLTQPQTKGASYTYPWQGDNRYNINSLCNDYVKTTAYKYIYASKLMEAHCPKTEGEMVAAIDAHSNGHSLGSCARRAYETQGAHGCHYSEQELFDFHYDLFVTKTLVGARQEEKVALGLQKKFPGYRVTRSKSLTDKNYAVDVLFYPRDTPKPQPLLAIQVKSKKYRDSKNESVLRAHADNAKRNEEFLRVTGLPKVLYVYYDNETPGKPFLQVPSFMAELRALLGENSN